MSVVSSHNSHTVVELVALAVLVVGNNFVVLVVVVGIGRCIHSLLVHRMVF